MFCKNLGNNILDVLLESTLELDHYGQTLHITSMVNQVLEIIYVVIYCAMALKVTEGLQFGKGHLCLILQTKLGDECRLELQPCGVSQRSNLCLKSEHPIHKKGCSTRLYVQAGPANLFFFSKELVSCQLHVQLTGVKEGSILSPIS